MHREEKKGKDVNNVNGIIFLRFSKLLNMVITILKLKRLCITTNLKEAHCWATIDSDLSSVERAKVVALKTPFLFCELVLNCVTRESHLPGVFSVMQFRNFALALQIK